MGSLLKLSHAIDRFSHLVGKSIIWLILLATLISALNAVARKAFNVGSNAFLEIQWYLFAAVFMLGAGHAFMQNAHVRIDVLANKLTLKTRVLIDIGGIVIFLLPLCYLVIDLSWPVVSNAYHSGEMSSNSGGLIRWPVFALAPLGFALLALQGISELIKRIGFLMGMAPNPFLIGGHGAPSEHSEHDGHDMHDEHAPTDHKTTHGEVRK